MRKAPSVREDAAAKATTEQAVGAAMAEAVAAEPPMVDPRVSLGSGIGVRNVPVGSGTCARCAMAYGYTSKAVSGELSMLSGAEGDSSRREEELRSNEIKNPFYFQIEAQVL